MIQTLIKKFFFCFFVFALFFGALLHDLIGWRGIDIASDILLLTAYLLLLISSKTHRISWGIVITLLIFLFYLAYSFLIAYYNTQNAITIDFVMQIRPYLAFFIVSQIACDFSASQKQLLKRLCFGIWIFFIPLSMFGLINPSSFAHGISQPANYASGIVSLSLLYLYCSQYTLRDRLAFLLMLSVGIIVTYNLFYGFFIITCSLLIYFHRRDIALSKLHAGIIIGLVLAATIYISESHISDYMSSRTITADADYGYTARSTLYQTSVAILRDFFPLGSGFASFATQASETYHSKIYADYGLNSINGLPMREWFLTSVSYYPSLAQFGIVGIILYLIFWAYIVWLTYRKFAKTNEIQTFVTVMILLTFVCIENVFDAFLTSNKGVFMMMFLGVLFKNNKPHAPFAPQKQKKKTPPVVLETLPVENIPQLDVHAIAETKTVCVDKKHVQATDSPDLDDNDDEYDDIEEYCEDMYDDDYAQSIASNNPVIVSNNNVIVSDDNAIAMHDNVMVTDENNISLIISNINADTNEDNNKTISMKNEYGAKDTPLSQSHPIAPTTVGQETPPPQTCSEQTTMEQAFHEVLENIKLQQEEQRRRLVENETVADNYADEEDDNEHFNYNI